MDILIKYGMIHDDEAEVDKRLYLHFILSIGVSYYQEDASHGHLTKSQCSSILCEVMRDSKATRTHSNRLDNGKIRRSGFGNRRFRFWVPSVTNGYMVLETGSSGFGLAI